jgi:DNA repair protein RecO (recombination protein O)
MPLRETEAVVLRTYRLGEADKIVSFFTRQFGRLRAVAGGAQRPKSRYGATLEPLSYVRLWVFERENRDLLRLNSTELLESFFEMQRDYRGQIATHYVSEVCERLLPERELNERVFRLLLAVLRGMKHPTDVERALLYFNYWLLRLGGFLPDLERCAACGRILGEARAFYGRGAEGLSCSSCVGQGGYAQPGRQACAGKGAPLRTNARESSSIKEWPTVSAQALSLGGRCSAMSLERWLSEKSSAETCRDARLFFEELVELHAEKRLVTRDLLTKALAGEGPHHDAGEAAAESAN